MLAILHITDLHFGKQAEEIFTDKQDLANSIAAAVARNCRGAKHKLLVVSGDLVYQGNPHAYTQAKLFLEDLCKAWRTQPEELLICPGNHDIVHAQADVFAPINAAINDLTHRPSRTFKGQTSLCVATPAADVLLINSAFHAKHEYGLVDPGHLPKFPRSDKPRIAVVHHNLLGVSENDPSTIRNAYQFLHELNRKRVLTVLHGHQHMLEDLYLGRPSCRVVGAGSLNFKSHNATPNQFNLLHIRGSTSQVLRYIWAPDVPTKGRLGAWKVFTQ